MSAALQSLLPVALQDLAELRRWVGWKWEIRNGRRTKVPKTKGNRNAETNSPVKWVSHGEASMWSQCDGVGFVLSGVQAKDLVAIDLDDVRDPASGDLLPWLSTPVEL